MYGVYGVQIENIQNVYDVSMLSQKKNVHVSDKSGTTIYFDSTIIATITMQVETYDTEPPSIWMFSKKTRQVHLRI